jgi:hypothetical protein
MLARVRAELNHTERIRGAREGMAMKISSDEGIDQVGMLCAEDTGLKQERNTCQQDEENQMFFHSCKNTKFWLILPDNPYEK